MAELPDVARLVREIQEGRSADESFRKIYEVYFPALVRFFANRGFAVTRAEDLAQEAFLRVYKNLGEFRSEASFETWLFKIATNGWKNALRARKALKREADEISLDAMKCPDDDEAAGWEPADPSDDALDQVLAQERTQILDKALEALPERMREVVLLRVGLDLTYQEIAKLLKIGVATVKSHLKTAKERLKPILAQHFDVFEL